MSGEGKKLEGPTQSASVGIPLHLKADDKTADVGKLLAEACRTLANRITTTWAFAPQDMDVEIVATLTIKEPA